MSLLRFSQKSGDLKAGRSVGDGETYYWSGRPQGHLEGVAVAVADRLVPMITQVTPVNVRIMRLRITHILSVISLVSMYAPTRVSEFSVENAFHAQLQVVIDSCPRGDTSIVLAVFDVSLARTEMAIRHVLDLTESHRARIEGRT